MKSALNPSPAFNAGVELLTTLPHCWHFTNIPLQTLKISGATGSHDTTGAVDFQLIRKLHLNPTPNPVPHLP